MTKKQRHITAEQISADLPPIEGVPAGELIGKGEGMTITYDADGKPESVSFGPCGWCGVGEYVGPVGSLWGTCDNCGAV